MGFPLQTSYSALSVHFLKISCCSLQAPHTIHRHHRMHIWQSGWWGTPRYHPLCGVRRRDLDRLPPGLTFFTNIFFRRAPSITHNNQLPQHAQRQRIISSSSGGTLIQKKQELNHHPPIVCPRSTRTSSSKRHHFVCCPLRTAEALLALRQSSSSSDRSAAWCGTPQGPNGVGKKKKKERSVMFVSSLPGDWSADDVAFPAVCGTLPPRYPVRRFDAVGRCVACPGMLYQNVIRSLPLRAARA